MLILLSSRTGVGSVASAIRLLSKYADGPLCSERTLVNAIHAIQVNEVSPDSMRIFKKSFDDGLSLCNTRSEISTAAAQ